MFNASAQYDLTNHVRLSMTVNNLFDEGLSRAGGEDPPGSQTPVLEQLSQGLCANVT